MPVDCVSRSITPLRTSNSSNPTTPGNQLICKDCAHDTIKEELKLQGFDKKIFRNLKKTLEKTNSLEKTLSILDPHFDPLKNRRLTLFDKTRKSKLLPYRP